MENKIDVLLIQRYLDGKLDAGQMHELEKQALDDPFLADALEGYSYAERGAPHGLSILQRQLHERIAAQHEEKNTFFFTWQRLSVGAAAGLTFIAAGILFWMITHKQPAAAPADSNNKKVEVELTPGVAGPKKQVVTDTVNKSDSVVTGKPIKKN